MKKYFTILILLFAFTLMHAQNNGVSAVLDFLTTNPSTAKNMTPGEQVGAQIISNFINNQVQKKHEINVARAGQTQVAVNNEHVVRDNYGAEGRLVREADGKVYFYYAEHRYPVPEKSLVRAMGVDYETDYTADKLAELKVKMETGPLEIKQIEEILTGTGYNFHKLTNGVCKVQMKYHPYTVLYDTKKGINTSSIVRVKKNTAVITSICYEPQELLYLYACKWINDVAEDGLHFADVHGIKTKFRQGEKLIFVMGYISPRNSIFLEKSYVNYSTGETILEVTEKMDLQGRNNLRWDIGNIELAPGKYMYVVSVKGFSNPTGETAMKTVFEVLPSEKQKVAPVVQKPTQKIPRGLIFYNEMKDGGFSGMNKATYNISDEKLTIGLNVKINDNNRNVIYQSFNLSGELLGTSTISISEVRFTGPSSNPKDNFDFIDMIKINGAGKYKIKAIVEATGEEFIRWVTIKM